MARRATSCLTNSRFDIEQQVRLPPGNAGIEPSSSSCPICLLACTRWRLACSCDRRTSRARTSNRSPRSLGPESLRLADERGARCRGHRDHHIELPTGGIPGQRVFAASGRRRGQPRSRSPPRPTHSLLEWTRHRRESIWCGCGSTASTVRSSTVWSTPPVFFNYRITIT